MPKLASSLCINSTTTAWCAGKAVLKLVSTSHDQLKLARLSCVRAETQGMLEHPLGFLLIFLPTLADIFPTKCQWLPSKQSCDTQWLQMANFTAEAMFLLGYRAQLFSPISVMWSTPFLFLLKNPLVWFFFLPKTFTVHLHLSFLCTS